MMRLMVLGLWVAGAVGVMGQPMTYRDQAFLARVDNTHPASVNLIPTAAIYGDPPGGGGYRSYAVSGITNGSNYFLSMGNAVSLNQVVGFDSVVITNGGMFTAGSGIYTLIGPADWAPTGPYAPITITATIFNR